MFLNRRFKNGLVGRQGISRSAGESDKGNRVFVYIKDGGVTLSNVIGAGIECFERNRTWLDWHECPRHKFSYRRAETRVLLNVGTLVTLGLKNGEAAGKKGEIPWISALNASWVACFLIGPKVTTQSDPENDRMGSVGMTVFTVFVSVLVVDGIAVIALDRGVKIRKNSNLVVLNPIWSGAGQEKIYRNILSGIPGSGEL